MQRARRSFIIRDQSFCACELRLPSCFYERAMKGILCKKVEVLSADFSRRVRLLARRMLIKIGMPMP